MALGVEGFTILAVLEARDQISRVIEHVDTVMESFGETARSVAEAVGSAGITIDESLLQTASGADAVQLANARLEASRSSLATATAAQADAEKALLDVQSKVAAGEMDQQEAQSALSASLKTLTDANTGVATATKAATAAQEQQMAVMAALADAADKEAAAAGVAIKSQADLDVAAANGVKTAGLMSKAMTIGALAVAGLGYESIKAAANFQDATTHLVTDAGENKNALQAAQAGILSLSAQTGTSANDLVNAMYHIDSAGYHVANGGLAVLKVAAEGAKVGGADLDTVSKTLVGSMNALGLGSGQAASMMNQLIATVGAGDMRMQDLASSISAVLPVAAAAKLSYAQVGGAIATMTAQGMSADQASQDLANTIRAMQAPTAGQIKEMQALGLNSNQVQMDLGKQGLTGTIQEMYSAIASHMKDGQVFISALNNSKAAAADANVELKQLPASLQKTAQGLLSGSVTAAQWSAAIKNMGVPQKEAATQFEALVKKTGQFNSLLTSGSPAAQTFNQALEKLMGNATAMNTALLVGGNRMATYQANVATIGAAAKTTGNSVNDWSTIQGTFNFKMEQLKSSVAAAGIAIGTVLIPPITKIADVIIPIVTHIATFITQNHTLVGLFLAVGTGIMVAVGAMKAWEIATKAWAAIQATVNILMGIFDAEVDANPIGLIVIAIAALVAALIYCYFHFKAFRDIVNDVFNFMKTAVVDVVNFVKDHWKLLIIIMLGPMGIMVGLISMYWRQIVEAAVDTWHGLVDAWHAIETAAVDVWHALVVAWDAVSNAATDTWHALETAWNAVSNAAETVWHVLTSTWDEILSVTERVWGMISAFFKKWWPLLFVIFMPVIAGLVALWNHFHQAVFNTAKTVWNAISRFFTTTWNDVKNVAMTVWNAVAGFLEEVWTTIKDVAISVWTTVRDFVHGIEVDIWHFIVMVWDAVFSYLKDRWGAIENDARIVWNEIYKYVVKPVEDIWHFINSIWDNDILPFLKARWASIENNAKTVWNGIYTSIISPIKKAWSDLVHLMDEITDAIKNGLNNAWNDVKNIGSEFVEIGKDIVNGIISGVTGAGGSLVSSLKNLANSALSGAKHFLGIGSPSTLFRDEVGQWIPAGIGAGIVGNTAVVKTALQQLATKMPSMVNKSTLGASLAAGFVGSASATGYGGVAGAAGGAGVYIDLRGSQVMSDADMTKLANQLGRVMTTKMLAQAGVRIRS